MVKTTNDLILLELENLASHFGEWSHNLVLGGGVALIVYDCCMAKVSARPIGTTDMDFLIPRRPILSANAEPLSQILESQGFYHRTKNTGQPPIESYVKEFKEIEIEVEFLTDDRARTKGNSTSIPKAQVVAQSLSYLEMSLESTTTAILSKGTKIRIVRPEAWVFHKGITFPRRRAQVKKVKDLYGIWFVLTMLGDLSVSTGSALNLLQSRQPPTWKKTFIENLNRWIATATPRDWVQLISQDPEQRLTEVSFRRLVERLSVRTMGVEHSKDE
jgi:hypothetical protein